MKGGLTHSPVARILKSSNAMRHHKNISLCVACSAPSPQVSSIQ